jgi:hypothetical protein
MTRMARSDVDLMAKTWEDLSEGDPRAPLLLVRFTPKALSELMHAVHMESIDAQIATSPGVVVTPLSGQHRGP